MSHGSGSKLSFYTPRVMQNCSVWVVIVIVNVAGKQKSSNCHLELSKSSLFQGC